METTTNKISLGCKVSGIFRGIGMETPFTGTVVGFDCGGGVSIDFDAPVPFRATDLRENAYFSRHDRSHIKVITPAVSGVEVIEFQGHFFLEKAV
jgi:hypothetical protein